MTIILFSNNCCIVIVIFVKQQQQQKNNVFDCAGFWCLAGNKESEVKEVDKVMYHDWRLIPKHVEHQFTDFAPLPEPPVRHVLYPPLLRAMILAQRKKTFGTQVAQEPMLPLQRDVLFNKDYFRKQEQEQRGTQGTAV